ncbi:MAG: rhodanese-like domain-containing protein [Opitutae bacterium]|nr:rhodanese-like domain-containing protein [Opitutae bacterium]
MKRLLPVLLSCLVASSALATEVAKITPKAADELLRTGKAVLVDVREPAEWAETGVAEKAVLLAKSDFEGAQKDWKPFLEKAGAKTIVLYCRSGRRSGAVAAALAEKGYTVLNAGGFKDWEAAGLPVRLVSDPAEKK